MSLITVTGGGAFTRQNIADINANFSRLEASLSGSVGNIIYCYPSSGYLGPQDGSIDAPYSDIVTAYGKGRNGKNDVIVLVGNGAASGSARISATLTWAKDALHLVGVDSGVNVSNRARIAPTSGATAFANFFVLSANGCLIQDVAFFHGFGTGTTAQICVNVTGSRNKFDNCHIAGMGDAASAQDAGSRSVKIGSGGSGENMFVNCTIGLDTVTRTVANASVEFAGATPRNQFINCLFPFQTSAAGVLGILATGNGSMDRFQYFDRCMFINNIKSTSTTMTVLASCTTASPGGLILHNRSVLVGIGEYGDTNGLANSYVDGLTGAAATSGIAVNPS